MAVEPVMHFIRGLSRRKNLDREKLIRALYDCVDFTLQQATELGMEIDELDELSFNYKAIKDDCEASKFQPDSQKWKFYRELAKNTKSKAWIVTMHQIVSLSFYEFNYKTTLLGNFHITLYNLCRITNPTMTPILFNETEFRLVQIAKKHL